MSRRILFAVLATAIAWVAAFSGARAESRVALVIGNSAYSHSDALPTPRNDANDVADTLERLGFSVIKILDGTFEDVRIALRIYNLRVQGADIGLIYFSGHGMELAGENWLIPVDAELKTDVDLVNSAISLKTFIQSASRASGLGLVILDACRDNPFAAKMQRSKLTRSVNRGFARIEPTTNVLVAYAAKDGTIAKDGKDRNSPYTSVLLKKLAAPGLEISYMFRNVRDEVMANTRRAQMPFVYGSLSSKAVYLNPPPGTAASAGSSSGSAPAVSSTAPALSPAAPVVAALPAAPADETIWPTIKGSTDPRLFQDFLARFPQSQHGSEARQRLEGSQFAKECDRVAGADIERDRARTVAVARTEDGAPEDSGGACEQAMRRFPEIARFAFQAGRIAEAGKDFSAARALYLKASTLGSPLAMLRLGFLYSQDNGLPADLAEARKWYEKAAEQNLPSAMLWLGLMHETGQGGAQDYTKAFELYRKAATAGDQRAMTNLGALYETGHGVRRDYAEARKWYEKAAMLGDWPAMASMGKLYQHGLGVRKNAVEARAWYKKAASGKAAENEKTIAQDAH